jgi:uncharacterized membrane protein
VPITVTCPSCGCKKSFADEKEGKKTTCRECDEPITIRRKRDRDDEDNEVFDEEKPKRRKSRDDDDDAEEQPRKRRRRDEDDEEDRARRKKKVAAQDDKVGVKVLSGVGGVVLVIGIILLRLWLRGRL